MYKAKKYNVVIILLLFIISAVVGLSAGMSSSAGLDNSLTPDIEAPPVEEETELPSGYKPPSASAKPLTKVLFAIDIVNNGKGYKSQTYQTLTIEALNVVQKMKFEKLRGKNGKLNLSQEWFEFSETGFLAAAGKNEYRSTLDDGTTMYEKIVKDRSKFNYGTKQIDYSASGEVKQFPRSDYLGAQNRMPLNDFFVNIDNATVPTAENIKEDKRTDPNNYIITINLNLSGLSSRYLSAFTANGGGAVEIAKTELTFYISKTTGMLRKVVKEERFKATYAGFASSWCVARLEETYLSMNTSFETEIKQIALQSYGVTL